MKKCLIPVFLAVLVLIPHIVYAFDAESVSETVSITPDKKTKKTKDGGTKGSIEITNNDEISLVVSADAPTKSDAIAMALRNAIEQAFGTFVSANTTILNDELVKDEIATITSGNIKGYKELSASTLPNGNTSVSLQAVVSIGKLISYSQSHGSSAEFAGQQFMMQKRMLDLNAKNEKAAIDNLFEEFLAVKHTFYNYKMTVGTPIAIYYPKRGRFRVKGYSFDYKNEKGMYTWYGNYTPESPDESKSTPFFDTAEFPDGSKSTPFFIAPAPKNSEYDYHHEPSPQVSFSDANYLIPLTIEVQTTENFKQFAEKFVGIWKTLALSEEEVNVYNESNYKLNTLSYCTMVQGVNNSVIGRPMWNFIHRKDVSFRTDAMNRITKQIVENLQQPELVLLKKTSDGKELLSDIKCYVSLGYCNALVWAGEIDSPSYYARRGLGKAAHWPFDSSDGDHFVLNMDQWDLTGAKIYGVYMCSEDELENIVGFEFYDPKAGHNQIWNNKKVNSLNSSSLKKSDSAKTSSVGPVIGQILLDILGIGVLVALLIVI